MFRLLEIGNFFILLLFPEFKTDLSEQTVNTLEIVLYKTL